MHQQLTRRELYDLAWAEPMRDLAKKFDLSDVGLAKIYKKANIPVPPRGYWARKNSGTKVIQIQLPHRAPGAPDRIWIGGRFHDWGWGAEREKNILEAPVPAEPTFDEDMGTLAERVRQLVGRVSILRDFQYAFGDINKLLTQDEKRRKSQWSFDKPLYDSGPARRRLLILHSLFFALRRVGCSPSMRTSQYIDQRDRGVHVRVGDGYVTFTLETCSDDSAGRLLLAFTSLPDGEKREWRDEANNRLEHQLSEIVVQILVTGEKTYRDGLVRSREWLIEQKEETRKGIAEREEERRRRAKERREKEERERIEALLAQATDLQNALTIRKYVEDMKRAIGPLSVPEGSFSEWERWALEQADRIDPSKSLKFMETHREN